MNSKEKNEHLESTAEILKAIAHPARLCILSCLLKGGGCNVSLLIDKLCLPQSTISQHISKLKVQGIITGERKGLEIKYTVINDEVKFILERLLKNIMEDSCDTE